MRSEMSMVALAALVIAGCESSKSVDFSPFQGIYQIDSDTLNSSACDVEGNPVAGSPPMLVIFSFFEIKNGRVATAISCSDAVYCRDIGTSQRPVPLGVGDFWAHFLQVTADGLTGSEITTCCTGVSGQTTCQEAGGWEFNLVKNGSKIRIESRELAATYTVAPDATCSSEPTTRTLTGTCSSLRVVNATFQEAL